MIYHNILLSEIFFDTKQMGDRETLLVFISAAEYLKVEVKGRFPDLIHLPRQGHPDSYLFTDSCGIAFHKDDTFWPPKINHKLDQTKNGGIFNYWYQLAIRNSFVVVRSAFHSHNNDRQLTMEIIMRLMASKFKSVI